MRPPPEVIAKAMKLFAEQAAKRRGFIERFGHARVPVCAKLGDKWMVAVGGRIFAQIQENPYNFVNFIHDTALHFFGEPYLEAEEAKPLAERHPAVQWMHAFCGSLRASKLTSRTNTISCGGIPSSLRSTSSRRPELLLR